MNQHEFIIWILAAALVVHTLDEVWQTEYQKSTQTWQTIVLNRHLYLENLPVFAFAIVTAIAGWKLPILSLILPAVGITHPILGHIVLNLYRQQWIPATISALLVFLPVSIWTYYGAATDGILTKHNAIVSGLIGLGISFMLIWLEEREIKANER